VSLISGCAAKGPSYTSVKATIPQLQSDKARLYFLREKSHAAGAIAARIQVNGIKVADLYSGGFTYLDQSPDNVFVMIDTFMNPQGEKWTGTFPLKNGKEYYFFITPSHNKILATALFGIVGAIVTQGGPFHAYHIPKKMALEKLQTMKFTDKEIAQQEKSWWKWSTDPEKPWWKW
jgi:hypothetical protein